LHSYDTISPWVLSSTWVSGGYLGSRYWNGYLGTHS